MLVISVLPAYGWAQPRESPADAAHAFDDAARQLDDDDAKATGVRKWMGPIRLGFIKAVHAPGLLEPTRRP